MCQCVRIPGLVIITETVIILFQENNMYVRTHTKVLSQVIGPKRPHLRANQMLRQYVKIVSTIAITHKLVIT